MSKFTVVPFPFVCGHLSHVLLFFFSPSPPHWNILTLASEVWFGLVLGQESLANCNVANGAKL